MAIHLQNEDEGEMSEINVTPLVDVMLVLLVVFIVTAPLLTQVIKVRLPETQKTEVVGDEHTAVLSVDTQGQPLLDGRPIPLDSIGSELKTLLQQDPNITIQLQVDRGAVFDHVAKVMAAARHSGVSKLTFVTLRE